MILIDTSVWVDHFRQRNVALAALLRDTQAACHPFVIGELACGNLANRPEIISLLSALPSLTKASDEEVLEFIGRHRLSGRGLGLVDIHLLASCMLDGVPLWSSDKRLVEAAAELGLAYVPA